MPELALLEARLRELGSVVVAFSGGADSAFLAWVAHDALGAGGAHAVTAVSPSLAPEERADCEALAAEWGLRWTPVFTDELADPAYSANDGERCFHCKTALMEAVAPLAAAEGRHRGARREPRRPRRPPSRASGRRPSGAPCSRSSTPGSPRPTCASGPDAWACARGTSRPPPAWPPASRTARRSPSACWSRWRAPSRHCGRSGFRQLRVRHYGDLARLEFDGPELDRAFAARDDVVAAVRAAGYTYVTLDLEGFRSGNLNQALRRDREAHE